MRSIRVPAERGEILDRNGHPLVANVGGTAVELSPPDLPKTWPARLAELRQLSHVLKVPLRQILVEVKARGNDPITPVTVRESVKRDAPINYLLENEQRFPGVRIVPTYIRSYNYGPLASPLLGYVSEISPAQLKGLRKYGYQAGDTIGQGGLESTYDRYLRGQAGLDQLRVDSLGRPRSDLVPVQSPKPGQSIRLTLDLKLQRAAEDAIRYGIGLAYGNQQYQADGGAIVALDPRDGSILAMASYPTYDPRVYTGRVTAKRLAAAGLTGATAKQMNYPGLEPRDRRRVSRRLDLEAGDSAGGTRDAHHLVLDRASVHARLQRPQPVRRPAPGVQERRSRCRRDDEPADRARGLVRHVVLPGRLRLLQRAAERRTPAPGLGGEVRVRPPHRGRRRARVERPAADARMAEADVHAEDRPDDWQIDREWKPGDSVQLAIGQKDLLVTPLQMARFYALLANGGKLVKPHLVQDVVEAGGGKSPPRSRTASSRRRRNRWASTPLAVVQDGLYQATHGPNGTSASVFGSFIPPSPARRVPRRRTRTTDQLDQSWWCGYGPRSTEPPKLVVCAIIENGGFGADAAAPAALKVFQQFFKSSETQTTPTATG